MLTRLKLFLLLTSFFITLSLAFAQGQPYRILPLGNSITQSNQDHYSYRYNLWKKLLDAKVDFNYIGSLNTNRNGNPDWPPYQGQQFDSDHEGHWGWSTDQILNGHPNEPDKGKLSDWLKTYTPDMVLLHLGSNDMFRNHPIPETLNEIRTVVSLIRDKNPFVQIFLAQLIPAYDQKVGPQAADNIKLFNQEIPDLAKELHTSQSPVILVDQQTGFDPKIGNDTWDGVHPNASGEEKIAQRWFNAIIEQINIVPVTYTNIAVSLTQENDVQLAWSTSTENNNNYFEILRAVNTDGFITVGKVQGAGNSSSPLNYTFKDTTAPYGNLTYQLKQVSLNGRSSFSDTVKIEKKQPLSAGLHSKSAPSQLVVYPSISTGKCVNLQLQGQKPYSEVEILVYSTDGKQLLRKQVLCTAEGKVEERIKMENVNKAGLYLVQVLLKGQQLNSKFVLSH